MQLHPFLRTRQRCEREVSEQDAIDPYITVEVLQDLILSGADALDPFPGRERVVFMSFLHNTQLEASRTSQTHDVVDPVELMLKDVLIEETNSVGRHFRRGDALKVDTATFTKPCG